MQPSTINWQPVKTRPRTPGAHITVKDAEGDLFNVTVDRQGQIPFADHELKAWVKNDQI